MKRCVLFFAMAFCPWLAIAQFKLSGIVKSDNKPLSSASVILENTDYAFSTDSKGFFEFKNIPSDEYQLIISYIGYESYRSKIILKSDQNISVELNSNSAFKEEVIISAIKAKKNDASTFSNISKAQIEEQNLGQDLPYILQNTPSVVVNSDAGTGIGYTGLRIRGSDATRINLTINGIPYNDSESQGLFLVNLPDLSSSINSIQIQRGVGSSTNGSAAFGASINILTNTVFNEPFVEVNSSAGSFNTLKNTLNFGTGKLKNNWSLDGRLSRIVSDGYIDRGSSELKSFFSSLTHIGKKDLFKVNVFSGAEKTYQSWYGVPEARINNDSAGISAFINRNFLDDEQANNLRNSGRNYNFYTYDNQTDNYQQNHYQAFYNREINSKLIAQIALHYTKGKGYFEEYRKQDNLLTYFPNSPLIDSIPNSDIIRRRWLDNDFYGTTFSTTYQANKSLQLIAGGAYNEYQGKHYGELIWSENIPADSIRKRYYEDEAFKTDFNAYTKLSYTKNKYTWFADLQYRIIRYSNTSFLPLNKAKLVLEPMNFFNPKFGVNYNLSDSVSFYLTGAISNKEINRDEFTNSTPESRPKPERLYNAEMGYRIQKNRFNFYANMFYMYYKNQLVLNGQLNDVGAYVRQNTPISYRAGIELSGDIRISSKFLLAANATFSENKIKSFSSFLDDYDDGGQLKQVFSNSTISFSPALTAGLQIQYEIFKSLSASLINRYVSRQYLDNTQNINRSIDSYLLHDLRFNYTVKSKNIKNLGLIFSLQNVLNKMYENNGYTFSYKSGGETTTENFYYPQAGRNYLVGISFKF